MEEEVPRGDHQRDHLTLIKALWELLALGEDRVQAIDLHGLFSKIDVRRDPLLDQPERERGLARRGRNRFAERAPPIAIEGDRKRCDETTAVDAALVAERRTRPAPGRAEC